MAETASSILVIIGPTASGKSALALELARQRNAEILSIDSMQVYRGMDIGTAKPTREEQTRVRHHLIDVVDPTEEFTVARFVETADQLLSNAQSTDQPIIATGGTPLYYKALFDGLFEGPPADEELRRTLREIDGAELHQRLEKIDPQAAARIHSNDTRRLIRALEVYELTGKPITEHQTEWSSNRRRHAARWIGLHWQKEAINQRINQRVKQMIAAGWPDEVRDLLKRYGPLSKTAGEATGYREMIQYVQGKLSLEEAVEQIKISTRQLARRQMKWFRRFPNVQWVDGEQPMERLIQFASARD